MRSDIGMTRERADWGPSLEGLQDQLDASREKRDCVYARLLDERERIHHLERDKRGLEGSLSAARDDNARLAEEVRLLRQQLAEARDYIALIDANRSLTERALTVPLEHGRLARPVAVRRP